MKHRHCILAIEFVVPISKSRNFSRNSYEFTSVVGEGTLGGSLTESLHLFAQTSGAAYGPVHQIP